MYGLCLLEWFRKEHSWDHLLRLLGQLGPDSRWEKAMYDDPDMAADLAEKALVSRDTGSKWKPGNIGWTLLNEQLAQLIDLQKHQMRMQSANPHARIEPFPRPETEFNRALERLEQEKIEGELARVYDFVAEGQQRWLAAQQQQGEQQ